MPSARHTAAAARASASTHVCWPRVRAAADVGTAPWPTLRCPPVGGMALIAAGLTASCADTSSSRGSQLRINTPNTSCPARTSSRAATAESTPPDTATATRRRWPRAARTHAGTALLPLLLLL
eukprot:1157711-Pelagomonas_calceolata.AAC.22